MGKLYSVNGTLLNPDANAVPCGLIAKSLFNDSFSLMKKTNSTAI